jgi:hypothetical protein
MVGADGGQFPKGKRGMFMTVSVLMLGMILLSLVFLLSEQIIESKISAAEFGDIDRTSWTYSSIEDGVSRIVSFYISASTQNGSVTIEQPLPFPRRMADKLDAFSQFETSYADQNVSMNLTNTKKGDFLIQPGGIEVVNSPGSFAIIPQNTGESHDSLNSYFIDLTFPEGRVREANWTLLSNSSNDSVSVHVRAHDPNYAVVLDIYSNVDRHNTSVLSIIDNLNNITQVALIQFRSPAALQIQTGTAIGLKTIVGFNNLVTLETNDTISVQSTVNKTGRVRIA